MIRMNVEYLEHNISFWVSCTNCSLKTSYAKYLGHVWYCVLSGYRVRLWDDFKDINDIIYFEEKYHLKIRTSTIRIRSSQLNDFSNFEVYLSSLPPVIVNWLLSSQKKIIYIYILWKYHVTYDDRHRKQEVNHYLQWYGTLQSGEGDQAGHIYLIKKGYPLPPFNFRRIAISKISNQ